MGTPGYAASKDFSRLVLFSGDLFNCSLPDVLELNKDKTRYNNYIHINKMTLKLIENYKKDGLKFLAYLLEKIALNHTTTLYEYYSLKL